MIRHRCVMSRMEWEWKVYKGISFFYTLFRLPTANDSSILLPSKTDCSITVVGDIEKTWIDKSEDKMFEKKKKVLLAV